MAPRGIAEIAASEPPAPSSRTDDGRLVPLSHNHPVAIATFQTWVARIPSGYAIDDLYDPAMWRQVELAHQARAGRPKPGDLIRCIAEDDAFDAFFVLSEAARGYRLTFSHGRLPEGGR
jgi:hypothetical protein